MGSGTRCSRRSKHIMPHVCHLPRCNIDKQLAQIQKDIDRKPAMIEKQMYITDTSSLKTRHHKSVIGRSHMNQKVNMPLSNNPWKLPIDHIHYSSVEKLIITIDVNKIHFIFITQ